MHQGEAELGVEKESLVADQAAEIGRAQGVVAAAPEEQGVVAARIEPAQAEGEQGVVVEAQVLAEIAFQGDRRPATC